MVDVGVMVAVGAVVAVGVTTAVAAMVACCAAMGVPVSPGDIASAVSVYWANIVCCLNAMAVLLAELLCCEGEVVPWDAATA